MRQQFTPVPSDISAHYWEHISGVILIICTNKTNKGKKIKKDGKKWSHPGLADTPGTMQSNVAKARAELHFDTSTKHPPVSHMVPEGPKA